MFRPHTDILKLVPASVPFYTCLGSWWDGGSCKESWYKLLQNVHGIQGCLHAGRCWIIWGVPTMSRYWRACNDACWKWTYYCSCKFAYILENNHIYFIALIALIYYYSTQYSTIYNFLLEMYKFTADINSFMVRYICIFQPCFTNMYSRYCIIGHRKRPIYFCRSNGLSNQLMSSYTIPTLVWFYSLY